MLEKQRLLNTYVNNVTLDETLDEIDGFIRERKKSYIVAINVDVVMKLALMMFMVIVVGVSHQCGQNSVNLRIKS